MTQGANGPIRSMLVDSRNASNSVHSFSPWGVQRLQFSADGAGGGLEDRTPIGFTPNTRYSWTHAVMTSSSGGDYAALLAAATPDVDQIDSDTPGYVYTGDMKTSDVLTLVEVSPGVPLQVSGGITVLQPFAFAYGSNGLIKNSNPNDFSGATGWTAGGSSFANEANVAGTKFVYGAPVRGGGQSPAGLFWAIDALVRVSFVGGNQLWNYDTLSQPTSILGKKAIVECDGMFFWPGTDRFLMYNGVVQELPNQLNSNWFFENLNMKNRNKVWGTRIARWGEIWWFYPRGDATECNYAVIFNYLEKTWYDAKLERSAGSQVQLFSYPIWGGKEDSKTTLAIPIGWRGLLTAPTAAASDVLNIDTTGTGIANGHKLSGTGIPDGATVSSFTGTTITMSAPAASIIPAGTVVTVSSMTAPYSIGDTVTDTTSGATGKVVRQMLTTISLESTVGLFGAGHVVTGALGGSSSILSAPYGQELDTIYQQEYGYDKVLGGDISAIPASFTTSDFGFAVGAPMLPSQQTADVTTRIVRVEPDFEQIGNITMTTQGRSFAKDDLTDVVTTVISQDSKFEDIRGAQARIIRVKIESNERGGYFKQGKVMLNLAAGDERSGETI